MTNAELIRRAADILGISRIEAEEQSRPVDGLDGCWFFWDCFRGGKSMIISEDEEMLVAGSSVSFAELRNEFASGRRTPLASE